MRLRTVRDDAFDALACDERTALDLPLFERPFAQKDVDGASGNTAKGGARGSNVEKKRHGFQSKEELDYYPESQKNAMGRASTISECYLPRHSMSRQQLKSVCFEALTL